MIKFRVYSQTDELIAIIQQIKPTKQYSLEFIVPTLSERPVLLQYKEITSQMLEYFLHNRVLPLSRSYVSEKIKSLGITDDTCLVEMIKLNSGRTLTDDFYILVEDTETNTVSDKSTKSSITTVDF